MELHHQADDGFYGAAKTLSSIGARLVMRSQNAVATITGRARTNPTGPWVIALSEFMTELLDRLRRDEDFRRQGVALVVDALLQRSVSELLDVAGLQDVVVRVMQAPIVGRVLDQHFDSAWERYREQCREADEAVSDNLSSSTQQRLQELVLSAELPRLQWMRNSVDPVLIRDLISPALSAWLTQFVAGMPLTASRRADAVPGDAEVRASGGTPTESAVTRLGGLLRSTRLVGNVQQRLKQSAGQFGRSTSADLLNAIKAQIESPEGQRKVRELRSQIFRSIVNTPVGEILEDVERLPLAQAQRLLPEILSHNAVREFAVNVIRQHINAIRTTEGNKTLLTILEEAGIAPQVRAYLRVQGEALTTTLLHGEALQAWLAQSSSSKSSAK